ncbi:MAG: hypothetical protein LBS45_11215 [Synergistaceae bacterium]|jgi:phage terminase Nu1 subunit (DNA packaging protein)|nr:hypothetical protein [Synergistaceae bacterium]
MESGNGLYHEKTIAELFGVTERRIRQLAQKKIIPKAGKGLYDLGPTVQAYIRYLHGLLNGAVSADMTELNQRLLQANTTEREAKARMAELDLSVMQGRLHEADHVKKIMIDMIAACRSRMLALPSKAAVTVSTMTGSAEIASFLREIIYEGKNMAKSKAEEMSISDVLPINDEGDSGGITRDSSTEESSRISREPVIYCGPSVPKGKIISGALYRGGLPKNIEAIVEKVPEIGRLIVPVGKLAETQRKTAVAGTEENRLYQVILSRRGEIENGV